jgi:hypothetical protein
MTALRKFRFAQLRALRAPRRLASRSYHHGRALRPQPLPRLNPARRAAGHAALARVLRLGVAVLFGLWALAALGFCAAVAVALIW